MNLSSQFILIFVAGIIFEALLLTGRTAQYKKLALITSLLLGLVVILFLIDAIQGRLVDWPHYARLFSLLFPIAFAYSFKKEILPVINEQIVLSLTVEFWFTFLGFFYSDVTYKNLLAILAIIPTIGALIIAFTNIHIKFWGRIFFYSWFLAIIVFLIIFQFSSGILSFLFSSLVDGQLPMTQLANLAPFNIFTHGMTFLYLAANAWYLYELIPIPGKSQSIQDRIRQWQAHLKLLSGKYSNYQLKSIHSLLIILIQGGSLILNYYFKLIPNSLFINTWILVAPFLFKDRPLKVNITS